MSSQTYRSVRALARSLAARVSTAFADARPDGLSRPAPYFPNVVLTTHDGKDVHFYDDLIRGRIALVNFMFTKCAGFCPITTPHLVEAQEILGGRVGRDIFLYSITLDPATDTPAVLTRYARAVGARPGWTFLTGTNEAITRLRRRLGFFSRDPVIDADRTQHSGLVVYGNDNLRRWAAISGLNKPEVIVRAVLRIAGPEGAAPS